MKGWCGGGIGRRSVGLRRGRRGRGRIGEVWAGNWRGVLVMNEGKRGDEWGGWYRRRRFSSLGWERRCFLVGVLESSLLLAEAWGCLRLVDDGVVVDDVVGTVDFWGAPILPLSAQVWRNGIKSYNPNLFRRLCHFLDGKTQLFKGKRVAENWMAAIDAEMISSTFTVSVASGGSRSSREVT